ncbi:MAG: lysine exporter LysO family protein [Emergencia sp.]
MVYVVLYMGAMFIGYVVGSRQRSRAEKFAFLGKIMSVCIFLMVFIMGLRMGSNEEVIKNLGTIGLQALAITGLIFVLSSLSITITRKIMGIDKWGCLKEKGAKENESTIIHIDETEEETESQEDDHGTWKITILIVVAVAIGLTTGYLIVRPAVQDIDTFYSICGTVMTVVLTSMLFVIGINLGIEGKVTSYMKQAGIKVFIFPVAVFLATTLTGVIVGALFNELSVKEGLAICYGYGWYTFAPIAIANAGYITASAVSFMHNVFRELLGIILIPVLAKYIGYIEVCCLPGTAGADIGMTVIARTTRQDIIVYSFTMGIIWTLLVPILVPLVIGL